MTHTPYSHFGSPWCEKVIDELNGTAFEIGIESDKKQRGAAVNVTVCDEDENQALFVAQVRKTEFHPRRFNRTRKDYFLCGRNDNGNAFAHPVELTRTNARVEVALCRIWQCTPSQLAKIIRQGDVALIPERALTFRDVEEFTVPEFAVGDSHIVTAERVYVGRDGVYVAGSRAQIRHTKQQHPHVAATLSPSKLYRVQLGIRAETWGFARPTFD